MYDRRLDGRSTLTITSCSISVYDVCVPLFLSLSSATVIKKSAFWVDTAKCDCNNTQSV